MALRQTTLILALALQLAAATVADMSGTWRLNVQKSRWGKHTKPDAGAVTIEHHEPAFKYSGTVTSPNGVVGEPGEATRTYAFDGAIDGKEYPVTGTLAAGNIVFRREGANIVTSDFKSSDGKLTQSARTTISSDGKTLTRTIEEKGPKGDVSWTEVYDRH
jgi:hypothetical protein